VNTSMALFLLVILGRAGAFAGASDYDSSSYTYTQEDLDAERIARDTGVHFTMFVLFVTAMNSAFLAKLVKRRGLSAGMDKE
jgi:hypothetical protein